MKSERNENVKQKSQTFLACDVMGDDESPRDKGDKKTPLDRKGPPDATESIPRLQIAAFIIKIIDEGKDKADGVNNGGKPSEDEKECY